MAAPITSLLIEKYLTGQSKKKWIEDRMLATDLSSIYQSQIKEPNKVEAGTNIIFFRIVLALVFFS